MTPEAKVGLDQHRAMHRPAAGNGSAVPIEDCPVDVCQEWVESYPELRRATAEKGSA